MKPPRLVCIRWTPSGWHVAYAANYLPVWRADLNCFASREEAETAIAKFNKRSTDVRLKLIDLEDDPLRREMPPDQFWNKAGDTWAR